MAMVFDYLLFFLFALTCEVLGTLGGFGSSVMFVPLAGFFLPRPMVLALTSILHVFSNTTKIVMFWKHINWKLFLLFGIPGLLFTVLGALLAGKVNSDIANWILGAFLLAFSIIMLIFPGLTFQPSAANSIWTGSIAGFAAGFIGTGGAIRGMALITFNLEKNVFVATSASIDFGVDFSRLFVYMNEGFMAGLDWIYVVILFAASWSGTWIGKILLNRIAQETFRKVVIGIIFATGVATIINVIR